MPGGRNAVGGGLQDTDDRSGAFLLREAAGSGTVHVVQGGDGDRVDGSPYADAAREGNRWETELGNHGSR